MYIYFATSNLSDSATLQGYYFYHDVDEVLIQLHGKLYLFIYFTSQCISAIFRGRTLADKMGFQTIGGGGGGGERETRTARSPCEATPRGTKEQRRSLCLQSVRAAGGEAKRDDATASARNAVNSRGGHARQSPAKRERGGGFATAVSAGVKKAPLIETRRATNGGPFELLSDV